MTVNYLQTSQRWCVYNNFVRKFCEWRYGGIDDYRTFLYFALIWPHLFICPFVYFAHRQHFFSWIFALGVNWFEYFCSSIARWDETEFFYPIVTFFCRATEQSNKTAIYNRGNCKNKQENPFFKQKNGHCIQFHKVY